MRYKTLIPLEYRSQNKRGGRPIKIEIPVGSVGIEMNGCLVFHNLARRGHNPFVFWIDVHDKVKKVEDVYR